MKYTCRQCGKLIQKLGELRFKRVDKDTQHAYHRDCLKDAK